VWGKRSGGGILHLSVLMESMRREGFEFQVGRPRVLFKKDENGNKMEPVEQAVVECPDEYSGKVVEVFGTSGGIMTSMDTSGIVTHLEFKIPTRGIMGLKNRIMNVTHGEGVFYHTFLEYGPYAGEIGNRQNGAMISMTTEKAVAYALGTLQERGQLFVEPGTECYEGMIVGERSKAGDMVVNIARTKNLGNQRSSTSDISVQLVPPRTFSLEEALEEQSILWADDADFAVIMVLRTLDDMRASQTDVPLLPQYKSEDDAVFVKELFRKTLVGYGEYIGYIDKYTSNWDVERIAFMDNLIMAAATAELLSFPSIPIKVTLDEYIEIAKYYSTPGSSVFINGVLDKIVEELTAEGRIRKSGRGLLEQ